MFSVFSPAAPRRETYWLVPRPFGPPKEVKEA